MKRSPILIYITLLFFFILLEHVECTLTYSQSSTIQIIKQQIKSTPELFNEVNKAQDVFESIESALKMCSASLLGKVEEAEHFKELKYSSEFLTKTLRGGIIHYNEKDLQSTSKSALNVSVMYTPMDWDNFLHVYYTNIKTTQIEKCTVNYKTPYLLFPIEIEKSLILQEITLLEYITQVAKQTNFANNEKISLNFANEKLLNTQQNNTHQILVDTQLGRHKLPLDYYVFESPASSDYYFNFDIDYPQVVPNAKLIGKIKAMNIKNAEAEIISYQKTLSAWKSFFTFAFDRFQSFSLSLPSLLLSPTLKTNEYAEMKSFKLITTNTTGIKLQSFSIPSHPHYSLYKEATLGVDKALGLFIGHIHNMSHSLILSKSPLPHLPLFLPSDLSSFHLWSESELDLASRLAKKANNLIGDNNKAMLFHWNEFYRFYYRFSEIIRHLPNLHRYLTFSNHKFTSDQFAFDFQFDMFDLPQLFPSIPPEQKKMVRVKEIIFEQVNKFEYSLAPFDYYNYFLPKLSTSMDITDLIHQYQIFTSSYSSEYSLSIPPIIRIFYRFMFSLQLINDVGGLHITYLFPEFVSPSSKEIQLIDPVTIKSEAITYIQQLINDISSENSLSQVEIDDKVAKVLADDFNELLSSLSFKTYLKDDLKLFAYLHSLIHSFM